MTWGKVDDQLHSHPKATTAGCEAMGLWVLALSFCCAYTLDGRVSRADARRIGGARGVVLAGKLVASGLWHEEGDGWVFHDWSRYQPTRADVLAERERKANAGRLGGLAKARAVAAASSDSASNGIAAAKHVDTAAALLPIPSPIPEIRETSVPDVGPAMPDRVREIFDHWLACWKRVVGGSNPPKLSDPRRAKIRARLTEGYTVEQVKTAIDAMWGSAFHVENRHYDIDLVCRSSTKLDAFLAKTESAKVPSAPTREVKAMGATQAISLMDRLARSAGVP